MPNRENCNYTPPFGKVFVTYYKLDPKTECYAGETGMDSDVRRMKKDDERIVKDALSIVRCRFCGKMAMTVDAGYPYLHAYTLCEEHFKELIHE